MSWSTASPTARNRLVESLTQQISDLIRRQQMQPGDRLPTVRALAEQFQVAVPTLREAIRRLEAFGVVDVRHGAGIFVRVSEPRFLVAGIGGRTVNEKTLLDLLQTRLLFEPYCAEQASRNQNVEELAQLATHLDRAERYLNGNDRLLQEMNMAFHVGVAKCSGNVVLAQVMESLADLYSSEQAAMLTLGGDARIRDYHEHRAILAVIEAGNPAHAREQMQQHLLNLITQVTPQLSAITRAHNAG